MSIGSHQFKSDWALRHINQGKAKGAARVLLTVLTGRGIDVPDDARDRITTCTDLDQLDTWLRHACTADTIDDVFAE